MQKRADISNAMVLKLLKENDNNVNIVRQKLNCSYRLVHDVLRGRRTDPKNLPKSFPKRSKVCAPGEEPCTCCGFRPKMKGNRYLCEYCYHNEAEVDEYAFLGSSMPNGMFSNYVV